ncbi:RNA 3'-terminal phosphate cyclase [Natranaeroarchaeum aerophilus]|uniref:RNA 3'-terminal phosphate cyclase n=1 Tax=Natranaeroarchaeum aerophilus TaxID=2917711 RepID=A0AAE3K5J9_9EURY|nr:RNA 3'-terminal phosphate cyclase [Natranaeroarchaeum aerophilus]MCL9814093.1 RNA 3'-terminal phosphate cyclase [Natranaeroarchaeum aerophilus]
MIDIDGSRGGGQIVRSSITLSILTDTPIRIEDVRGDRPNPGLKHQHCSAVELAAEIAAADVTGVELGATGIAFDPGRVSGGDYETMIGTAGSITLVFDTVLPLATVIDEPLSVTVGGGTDVKWSPPLDYYRRVKLPFLRRYGLQAAIDPARRGFYPAGGGRARLRTAPSTLAPIRATNRGERRHIRIYSVASEHLDDADVAPRQAKTVSEALPADASVAERVSTVAAADSPGSATVIAAAYENGCAGFTAFGERGKPAEEVGSDAVAALREFERSDAAVGEHLADQLLLPMAIAGGSITIPQTTDHVKSSVELLERFGIECRVDDAGEATTVRIDDPISGQK